MKIRPVHGKVTWDTKSVQQNKKLGKTLQNSVPKHITQFPKKQNKNWRQNTTTSLP